MKSFLFLALLCISCSTSAQTRVPINDGTGLYTFLKNATTLSANQSVYFPKSIDGKTVVAVSAFSSTQTYSTGDLLYCSNLTHNWLSALAIGSPGNYIGISGGLPHWQNIDGSEVAHVVLNNPDGTTYLTHNDIQPTVDVAPLRLENFATGTADLFDVHSNETGPGFVFWLSHNGQAHIYPSSDATTLQVNTSNAGASDLLRGTKRNGGGTGTNVYTLSYLGGVTQSDNLSVGPVSAWLGSAYLTVHASGHIVADTGLLAGTNTSRGILELTDGSSGFAAHINGPSSAMAGDIDWYWPSADGSSGQFLKTDGSGNLSWASGGMTNPMTALGDIIYENATPAPARLAGHIGTEKRFLTQTGTGSGSAAPVWFNLFNTANTWAVQQTFTTGAGSSDIVANIDGVGVPNWAGSYSPGLTLINNTAATSLQNQNSPAIVLQGAGWKTNATAASVGTFGYIELRTRTNTAQPDAEMAFGLGCTGVTIDSILTLWRDFNGSQPVMTFGAASLSGGALALGCDRTSSGAGGAAFIRGQNANGTNQLGGNVIVRVGAPTGNKLGQALEFQSFGAGSSGSTVNTSPIDLMKLAPISATISKVSFGSSSAVTGIINVCNSATANASCGTGTLVAGTVTISTTAVATGDLIFLTDVTGGTNIGTVSVGTITNGVSFVVTSTNVLDNSSFNWLIIRPN